MKIYFVGSIRGGRDDKELYLEIINILGKYGKVLTEHIGDKTLSAMGEDGPTDKYIYDRDMAWLNEADIVVAEVTTPSLRVGYEIGKIEGKKSALCLYREQDGKRISAMIGGNKNLQIKKYKDLYDVQKILQEFFGAKVETTFKPKDGQVDFTNIRYAPVINCVVRHNDKILIVQRNSKMRLYPNFWNGISGFLDDGRRIEEKVKDELREELGIEANDIVSIHRGPVFDQEEEKYNKTWIVHPILVDVKVDKIKLDWEAQNHKWIKVEDAKTFDLLPGFDRVLASLFY